MGKSFSMPFPNVLYCLNLIEEFKFNIIILVLEISSFTCYFTLIAAVWVKSGDLIVMANESRVAYHAVPCIVKESDGDEPPEPLKISEDSVDTATDDTTNSMNHQAAATRPYEKSMCYCGSENDKVHLWSTLNMNKTEWGPFAKYLSRTRININVRQVHRR